MSCGVAEGGVHAVGGEFEAGVPLHGLEEFVRGGLADLLLESKVLADQSCALNFKVGVHAAGAGDHGLRLGGVEESGDEAGVHAAGKKDGLWGMWEFEGAHDSGEALDHGLFGIGGGGGCRKRGVGWALVDFYGGCPGGEPCAGSESFDMFPEGLSADGMHGAEDSGEAVEIVFWGKGGVMAGDPRNGRDHKPVGAGDMVEGKDAEGIGGGAQRGGCMVDGENGAIPAHGLIGKVVEGDGVEIRGEKFAAEEIGLSWGGGLLNRGCACAAAEDLPGAMAPFMVDERMPGWEGLLSDGVEGFPGTLGRGVVDGGKQGHGRGSGGGSFFGLKSLVDPGVTGGGIGEKEGPAGTG